MSQPASTLSEASPSNRFALAALLLGGAAIGGSPIFVRLSEVGPMATAFWRVALALIPIFIVSLMKKERGPKPQNLSDYGMLVLPGVMLALDLGAWHLSLTMTSVANATLLANLAPVFVTLIAFLFFSAQISRIFILGLAVALCGVVILKGGPAAVGNAGSCRQWRSQRRRHGDDRRLLLCLLHPCDRQAAQPVRYDPHHVVEHGLRRRLHLSDRPHL